MALLQRPPRMKNLVILGAGTGGTLMANKLRARVPDSWRITVVDRDNDHIYQPGLLFLPFGLYRPTEVVRPRDEFLPDGVDFRVAEVDTVDASAKKIVFCDGSRLAYDVLVVATGAKTVPAKTEGMLGAGWNETVFDFYTLEGATALGRALEGWKGGRFVINPIEMPIKCPVAPLELAFLADHFFHERNMRDAVEIVYATPLDAAFTKPRAAAELGALLERKNITLETNWNTSKVDGEKGVMEAYDGRTLDFDILVAVPLHYGSDWVEKSSLGDGNGFLPTDKHSLQVEGQPDIFALGDTTNVPASKAGSVAHFQGEVVVENVVRHIEGLLPLPAFDGHTNCFIETGFGKAILIDFNYDTEPLPGRYPFPGVGPFSLLEETAINHWGKLGFKWVYWNLLLKGEDMGLDHRMLMAGKQA